MRAAHTAEFEAFVLSRSSVLLRTAHLLTGDRGHAEDLLQTALERLARHWHRIDGDPEGWVRRTMVNLSTDRWRRRVRRVHEVGDLPVHQAAAGDQTLVVEQRLDLVAQLRTLTARQRAVLVLRYFDDLPEAEVAAVLGCSVGNVKSTSSRALVRLRTPTKTRSLA